jgi:hypothetical protein
MPKSILSSGGKTPVKNKKISLGKENSQAKFINPPPFGFPSFYKGGHFKKPLN